MAKKMGGLTQQSTSSRTVPSMNRHERRKKAAITRRSLPLVHRHCGDCTACCTILEVQDPLKKGHYEKCVHESGKCDIYKDRPKDCRTWRCGWHIGFLGEDGRPDKLGVMIDATKDSKAIVFWELFQGAADTPKVRALVDSWSEKVPVIIAFKDQRRIVGTSENVDLRMLKTLA
jgi:hypothetical protein